MPAQHVESPGVVTGRKPAPALQLTVPNIRHRRACPMYITDNHQGVGLTAWHNNMTHMSGTSAVHPSATTMVCLYNRNSVPRTRPAAAAVFAYVGPLMCRVSV
jgi:hypothetical protein